MVNVIVTSVIIQFHVKALVNIFSMMVLNEYMLCLPEIVSAVATASIE